MEEKNEARPSKIMVFLREYGNYLFAFFLGVVTGVIIMEVIELVAEKRASADVDEFLKKMERQSQDIENFNQDIKERKKRDEEWLKRSDILLAVQARTKDEWDEYLHKSEDEGIAQKAWLNSECGKRSTTAWKNLDAAQGEKEEERFLDEWIKAEEEKDKCPEWKTYGKAIKDKSAAWRKFIEAEKSNREDYEKASKALEEVSLDTKPSAP